MDGQGALATFPILVDHLEHVAVHRLAKKEALERRGPERLDEGRALFDQPRFERRKLLQRVNTATCRPNSLSNGDTSNPST